MTTTRSYRTAMPIDVAASELRACAGSQLDPAVVDAVLASVAAREPARLDAPPRELATA